MTMRHYTSGGLVLLFGMGASAQFAATQPATTAPAADGNTVIVKWDAPKADARPSAPARFPARFTPESLMSFLKGNADRLPLPIRAQSEQDAILAALEKIDMGSLLDELEEPLTAKFGDRIDWKGGLIVEMVPAEQQVTIDLGDVGLKPYQGPKRRVHGLVISGVTDEEYVVVALEMMEKARQMLQTGDPLYDRTHPGHLKADAEREVKEIRARQAEEAALAKDKEAARKRVGEMLGVYQPSTGRFEGEAKWVKESRRFSYVVNPKTGVFIERLKPVVERINKEMALAGFSGPTPLDKPGVYFDPHLGDVEVVLPKPMVTAFLAETDALEQRMAEKLTISIEAVRLTDRDIVNGALAARLNAEMLGVHDVEYGYDTQAVLRRVGINALTAIANQRLQINQLNSVPAGSWPAAVPLVTLDPPPLPPLQETRSWTSVGGDWSVGADPIFFDGRQQTFGLTYVDPNGVSHTLGLDVTDSLRKFWSRIERNLIVHKIKKDPLLPPTKFSVPVGPNSNAYDGLAALISQEDQNLIVATGTGAISQISAKAGTWLIIQDFQIAPLPGSSTALTEEELEELELKTLLTMFLRDPNTDVDQKKAFLESGTIDNLRGLLSQQLEKCQAEPILKGPRSRTYGMAFESRHKEAVDSAAVKKKEENSVIALTFYSSQGNIIQSPGATQLGSANDLTALTTELQPNAVTPISSFVLKTLENTESTSPLTGLNKGDSSDESKNMAHLLVRARFPTAEREKNEVEEGRQLGYFKLPLEREPLSTTSLPFLSSSDHPLERLASFRVGAMFDALQASKIRRSFNFFQPNMLQGTVTEGAWKRATGRLLLNLKIIGDSPTRSTTMAPRCREQFVVQVRSLLEYDPDFFDEPNVALRTMFEWNNADRIVTALNNSPGRFALQRLVTILDELGAQLVPDEYANEYLAVADYRLMEGHRIRPLDENELRLVRRDVANHFMRQSQAYGDAFLEAVSSILGLGTYRGEKESDLERGPFRGYRDLVVFDRSGWASESVPEVRDRAHDKFMTLKSGGYKGALFQPSLLTVEDMDRESRNFVLRSEDVLR